MFLPRDPLIQHGRMFGTNIIGVLFTFGESWTDADIQFPMSIDKAGSLYTIQHIGTIFFSVIEKKTGKKGARLNASSEFKDASTAE